MKSSFYHRGAALPLVLWATFVISTVVIVAMTVVDFDLDLEMIASRRFLARQAALTGVAFASSPQVKPGDALLHQTLPDGSRLAAEIESEDARLNINFLLSQGDTKMLKELFRLWGVQEEDAAVAVDCLKDWVDANDLRNLHGAEASDLKDEEYSKPENRSFLNVAEMQNVKGVDAIQRANPDWAKYFSVRSSGKLDIRYAAPDLLQVFGKLTREQAVQIIAFRDGPDKQHGTLDDPQISSLQAIGAIIPLSALQINALNAWFGSAGVLKRIVSRGISGSAIHEITVIFPENGDPMTNCLEWSEK